MSDSPPDDFYETDPASDERWNAGVDYAITQLCSVFGVDPKAISWDAATETLDGDVSSVLCNVLVAAYGEEWSSNERDTSAIRELLRLHSPIESNTEPVAWTNEFWLSQVGGHHPTMIETGMARSGTHDVPLYLAPPVSVAPAEPPFEVLASETVSAWSQGLGFAADHPAVRQLAREAEFYRETAALEFPQRARGEASSEPFRT